MGIEFEAYVGDVGTILRAEFRDRDESVVDISAASTKEIWLRKPDDTTVKKSGSFTTDGTDGKLEYAIESGVLDAAGVWKYCGFIALAGGNQWRSSEIEFRVYETW